MITNAPDTPSEAPPADIIAFNFVTGQAMLDNGQTVPIIVMYDRLGDETSDSDLATALIAGDEEWGYWTVILDDADDGDTDEPPAPEAPIAPLSNTIH